MLRLGKKAFGFLLSAGPAACFQGTRWMHGIRSFEPSSSAIRSNSTEESHVEILSPFPFEHHLTSRWACINANHHKAGATPEIVFCPRIHAYHHTPQEHSAHHSYNYATYVCQRLTI